MSLFDIERTKVLKPYDSSKESFHFNQNGDKVISRSPVFETKHPSSNVTINYSSKTNPVLPVLNEEKEEIKENIIFSSLGNRNSFSFRNQDKYSFEEIFKRHSFQLAFELKRKSLENAYNGKFDYDLDPPVSAEYTLAERNNKAIRDILKKYEKLQNLAYKEIDKFLNSPDSDPLYVNTTFNFSSSPRKSFFNNQNRQLSFYERLEVEDKKACKKILSMYKNHYEELCNASPSLKNVPENLSLLSRDPESMDFFKKLKATVSILANTSNFALPYKLFLKSLSSHKSSFKNIYKWTSNDFVESMVRYNTSIPRSTIDKIDPKISNIVFEDRSSISAYSIIANLHSAKCRLSTISQMDAEINMLKFYQMINRSKEERSSYRSFSNRSEAEFLADSVNYLKSCSAFYDQGINYSISADSRFSKAYQAIRQDLLLDIDKNGENLLSYENKEEIEDDFKIKDLKNASPSSCNGTIDLLVFKLNGKECAIPVFNIRSFSFNTPIPNNKSMIFDSISCSVGLPTDEKIFNDKPNFSVESIHKFPQKAAIFNENTTSFNPGIFQFAVMAVPDGDKNLKYKIIDTEGNCVDLPESISVVPLSPFSKNVTDYKNFEHYQYAGHFNRFTGILSDKIHFPLKKWESFSPDSGSKTLHSLNPDDSISSELCKYCNLEYKEIPNNAQPFSETAFSKNLQRSSKNLEEDNSKFSEVSQFIEDFFS